MSIVPTELRASRWLVAVLATLVLMGALQALPAGWQDWLRYDRDALAGGQAWRLLTAPLIHLGWAHLGLNAVGLALVSWIFASAWPPWRWLLALGIAGLISTLGVHVANPEVYWLVGLSGALHGLFAFGAVGWVFAGDRMGWVLLAGLGAKLAAEAWLGGMPVSEAIVGGAVITAAHLWGAVGGLIAAALDRGCFHRGPASL